MNKKKLYILGIIIFLCSLFFLINYSSLTGFVGFNIQSYNNLSEAILANDCDDVENWDISQMTDFSELFKDTNNFNCDLTSWDVSNITNMNYLFKNSINFSGNISNWNIENVIDMSNLFYNLSNSTLSISNWNPKNVIYMDELFSYAKNLNVGDLSNWNTSSVTGLNAMCSNSNNISGDLSNWNLINVLDSFGIFYDSDNFNANISNWNLENLASFQMFFSDTNNFSGDLSNWNTNSLNNLDSIFSNSNNFSGNLSNWNISGVNSMSQAFSSSKNFNSNLSNWDVSNVIGMGQLFMDSENFSGDLSNWNLSQIDDFGGEGSGFFFQTKNFSGDLSNWDITNVNDFSFSFFTTENFNAKGLNTWDTSEVTDMYMIFYDAINFSSNISNWNTSNVIDMGLAFADTINFSSNISNWDTSKVTEMGSLLLRAINFYYLDISNWNISSVTDLSHFATEIPTELYDKLLINWGSQELQRDVVWDLGNTNYTEGNPEIYKNRIITEYNWTINDGGMIEDVISPKINIISPIEEENYSNNNIEININVYDVNLKEIYYNYNGLNKSYNQTIIEIIENGEYNLQIWAIDNYDNINYSNIIFSVSGNEILEEENEIEFNNQKNVNMGNIGYIPDKHLEQGYTNYYSEKESESFNLNEDTHKMTIETIKENKVTIKIESEPLIKELSIGEEWKIDFEMDDIYDLYIKVNSIENNKANILIKKINEYYSIKQINEVETDIEKELPQKERDNTHYYFISVILLILILLIFHLKKKYKK